jgi:hypothetical protein
MMFQEGSSSSESRKSWIFVNAGESERLSSTKTDQQHPTDKLLETPKADCGLVVLFVVLPMTYDFLCT